MKLDAQQLPSSLQHLHLSGISVDGATLSDCLSRLHSLASLKLDSCMCIISLPPREVLRNLRRLQTVKIYNCKMLISLGGLAALASLEKLAIRDCPNLMTVVPSDDSHDQSSTGALLPESLTHLIIQDCRFLDTYMGRCLMGLTRLSDLRMYKCQHMTSLPTAEELMHLTSLKHLSIEECELLVSVGGLHVLLSSLGFLGVAKCPGLFSTLKSAAADQRPTGLLVPGSLTKSRASISVHYTGSSPRSYKMLRGSFARVQRALTLTSYGGRLSPLSKKKSAAAGAADVATDIPDVDALSPPHGLSSFFWLGIDNLSLLPVLLSRKGLESLTSLALGKFSQNTAFTREQEEWFQHLPSLRMLVFLDCERLPSLPGNLTSLTRLKQLHIRKCPQVSSLPTLPMSLEYLDINGRHPLLGQRYGEGGPDWDLIKHIP